LLAAACSAGKSSNEEASRLQTIRKTNPARYTPPEAQLINSIAKPSCTDSSPTTSLARDFDVAGSLDARASAARNTFVADGWRVESDEREMEQSILRRQIALTRDYQNWTATTLISVLKDPIRFQRADGSAVKYNLEILVSAPSVKSC
jgi:hypothetical protein